MDGAAVNPAGWARKQEQGGRLMDLFRAHTQRAAEGSDLPCPSDCISGVLVQAILFIADQGAAGTEGRSLPSVTGELCGASEGGVRPTSVRVRTCTEASVPSC